MEKLIRILTKIIISLFLFYFIYPLFLAPFHYFTEINESIFRIIALLPALVIVFLLWKKLKFTPGQSSYIIMGGVVTGFIFFIPGFFGPLIFSPESNQGPLLGILITGPLGFFLGLLIGGVIWSKKSKK